MVKDIDFTNAVENLFPDKTVCPSNIHRSHVYTLIQGRNATRRIIQTFLNILKLNDSELEGI